MVRPPQHPRRASAFERPHLDEWFAIVRDRLTRQSRGYWLAVGATSLLAAGIVGGLARSAAQARARWGAITSAVVAVHALSPDQPIGNGDVRRVPVPRALAPADALRQAPVGQRPLVAISANQVLVAAQVSSNATTGLANLLHAGEVAFGIPREGQPASAAGENVVLYGASGTLDETVVVVARRARVVAANDKNITVAVGEADGPAVAAAIAKGSVVIGQTSAAP